MRTRVVAFHKPIGLITSHRDEHGRETVYDRLRSLMPPALASLDWHAIGRLDADTTGLLLFTNDGALIHHATHAPHAPQPATHATHATHTTDATQPAPRLDKTYRVLAKGLLTDAQLERLRSGVELTGGLGQSAPATVLVTGHQIATTWLELTIAEGKNRQVRRMLLAVDSQVIRLARVRFGGLVLDLPENSWRELSPLEIERDLGYAVRPLEASRRPTPSKTSRPVAVSPAAPRTRRSRP